MKKMMRGKKRENRSCGDLALAFVVFGSRSEAYSMVVRVESDEERAREGSKERLESFSHFVSGVLTLYTSMYTESCTRASELANMEKANSSFFRMFRKSFRS